MQPPRTQTINNERNDATESFEITERKKMTKALSHATKANHSDLYEAIFDSLLALIVAYVRFRKAWPLNSNIRHATRASP